MKKRSNTVFSVDICKKDDVIIHVIFLFYQLKKCNRKKFVVEFQGCGYLALCGESYHVNFLAAMVLLGIYGVILY